MKSEQINSYTEIKQKTDRDVRQLGILVSESYETESTDQQTVINLNMSVDINNKKQVWVFIDGQKLVEGATGNYTFTNIVSNVSAQITLNAPLIAGLPIQVYKLGAYQETFPNPSSVTATLLNDVAQPQKMALDGFSSFVKKTFITAPNTTIVNRAQVEAASLKAIAGVERIPFRGITLIRTEFGSAGEPVWELESKDSRVRFVGAGWISSSTTHGNYQTTTSQVDYVELVFYGTGLNLLMGPVASSADFRATIDGGAEGANFIPTTLSSVLNSRNYAQNTIIPVVSNLSLGFHTVKVRAGGANMNLNLHGFEIHNQRTDLAVLAGTAYGGMKQETLGVLSTSAFNTGVVGTRGARVIKYLKDGVISQVVTNVNGASAFTTSADHTNEEITKKINFREFGAGRSDDFSTLSTSSRTSAFTLDDGSTSLMGTAVAIQATVIDKIYNTANGAAITLTFIGTGIDIIRIDTQTGASADTFSYSIDGTIVGTVSGSGTQLQRLEKIASGLPYGTHTFKMTRTSAPTTWDLGITDFIIYQPKKPSIPSGAIEVTDYNVMADYVATASGANGAIGTGVLRKNALREIMASGTWSAPAMDPTNFECGFNHNMTGVGSYMEYSFYGTGVIFTGSYATTQVQNALITIDGASNLSAFSTSIVQGGSGAVFTASTGAISGTVSGNNIMRIQINGLSLGLHKIRVTQNTASGQLYVNGFDVITPIHINSSSFKIGNLSLRDSRAFSPIIDKPNQVDLSKAKAWITFDGINNKILNSFNVSSVLRLSTGLYNYYLDKPFKDVNYTIVTSGNTSEAYVQDSSLIGGKGKNNIQILYRNSSNVPADILNATVLFFGELEDEGEI